MDLFENFELFGNVDEAPSFLESIKQNKHVIMGEHITGLSRWYAGLIIFKNSLRIRIGDQLRKLV